MGEPIEKAAAPEDSSSREPAIGGGPASPGGGEPRALFVVHAAADAWFVHGELLPALGWPRPLVQLSSELVPGELILPAIDRGAARGRLTVVVISRAFLADPWAEHAELLASHAAVAGDELRVIPVILEEVEVPPRLQLRQAVDLRQPWRREQELSRLAAALPADGAGGESGAALAAENDARSCPYPGMRSLEEGDAALLFGRAQKIEEIAARLAAGERELVLLGPSGSGKSSLVCAGVLPRLARGVAGAPGLVGVVTRRFRPGEAPAARLAAALSAGRQELAARDAVEGGAAHGSGDCPGALSGSRPAAGEGGGARRHLLLIVVDQLEEAFALASAQERERFFAALVELRDDARCVLIYCLRAEFLGELTYSPLWREGRELVIGPLRDEGLRQAIERPAAAAGVYLEPGLTERLLADAGGDLGSLPLLQETLVQLWALRRRRVLPLSAYEAMGAAAQAAAKSAKPAVATAAAGPGAGVLAGAPMGGGKAHSGFAVAISRRAAGCLDALSPARQEIARRILLRLVNFGEGSVDTRHQRRRSALELAGEPAAELTAVLDHLASARLVITDASRELCEVAPGALASATPLIAAPRNGLAALRRDRRVELRVDPRVDPRVDLAHEALIKAWDRLAGWIRDRRVDGQRHRRLEHAAALWVARGRATGGLLQAHELAQEQAWRRTPAARELGESPELRDFFLASAGAARRQGRTQLVLIAGGAVALLLLVLSILYVSSSSREVDASRADLLALGAQRQELAQLSQRQRAAAHQETARALLLQHRPQRAIPYLVAARAEVGGATNPALESMFRAATGAWQAASLWHDAELRALAISPDGAVVATGSADGTARLWHLGGEPGALGEPASQPLPHGAAVEALAFSPDGTRLVTGGADGAARLWRIAALPTLATSPVGAAAALVLRHPGAVRGVAFSPDGGRLLTVSADGVARLWSTAGRLLAAIPHGSFVACAAFSPDGSLIATGGGDHAMRLWHVATGEPAGEPMFHRDAVRQLSWSRDAARLLTVTVEDGASVWDVAARRHLFAPLTHRIGVRAAAFSPDDTRVVTAGEDGTARLWDARTGASAQLYLHHDAAVELAVWSHDGARLVTVSEDKTARLWDARSGAPLSPVLEHGAPVRLAALDRRGHLVTAGGDRFARLWHLAAATAPLRWEHPDAVVSVAVSPDGALLATGGHDKLARLWPRAVAGDLERLARCRSARKAERAAGRSEHPGRRRAAGDRDGDRSADLDRADSAALAAGCPIELPHQGRVEHLSWSRDGARLVTASGDGTARIWDASGAPLGPPLRHPRRVWSAAFSPDGELLATGGADHDVRLWQAGRRGAELRALLAFSPLPTLAAQVVTASAELLAHPGEVRAVAFSPDGRWLATACADGVARLWDLSSRTVARALPHDGELQSVAFSPDGSKLTTASKGRAAYVWILATGELAFPPLLHDGAVTSARFSPDGARLATASRDHQIRVWDAASGALLGPPLRLSADARAAEWTPDGQWLAVAGHDRAVQLWDAGVDRGSLEAWQAVAARGAFRLERGVLSTAPPPCPSMRECPGSGRSGPAPPALSAPSAPSAPSLHAEPAPPLVAVAPSHQQPPAPSHLPPSSPSPPSSSSPSPPSAAPPSLASSSLPLAPLPPSAHGAPTATCPPALPGVHSLLPSPSPLAGAPSAPCAPASPR